MQVSKKLSQESPVLRNLFSDLGAQPEWRGRAGVLMAWRDSEQWSKMQIKYLESLGLSPFKVNLMAPAIEAVTGYEAKHRVDWMISAADEEQDEMAEAVNHTLNDEMRLADANDACSDAYESQACVGIGWVRVGRSTDIMSPNKLDIEFIHRDEIFWDMRARSKDLRRDCRWITRRKFTDKDDAIAFFGPKYKELIEFTHSDWHEIEIAPEGQVFEWYSELRDYSEPIELIMENLSSRKMIAIYKVYFKVVENRRVIMSPSVPAMEFDQNNPLHLNILATGQGQLMTAPINVCKMAWFIGPHLIWVGPSSEPHNHFPYVPFFGTKKDAENTPQGLLERMIGPQEEYNRAVVEIQRILRQRRIEKDYDALHKMSDEQALFEISRTDGVINLKKGREFRVVREWEKIAVLEGICSRSREEINAASGIYQTFQGQTEGDQSGIAVESIAELGAQTLGKINSNYQLARKQVGDLAFHHIVKGMGTRPMTVNIPHEMGQQKKQIALNEGQNNVPLLRAQVAIQDVHTSAGYKQHTHMRLTGIMREIPDEFKGVLLPFWLESSELPKKEQAIKAVNKSLGYEEDEAKREQAEDEQAKAQEEQRQLEIRKFVAEIEEKEASAKDKNAQANNHMADAMKKRIETAQLIKNFKLENLARAKGSQVAPAGPASPVANVANVANKALPAPKPQPSKSDQLKALLPGPSGEKRNTASNGSASAPPR